MKIAALDLGSNTFLLLIAEVENGRVVRVYRDEMRVVRLAQGVHQSKSFHPDALQRAEACLKEYAQIIENERVDRVLAMATSASRDVNNADALFALGAKYDIPIEIIPGSREAEITFRGSTSDEADATGLAVIDVGGGSTEIMAKLEDGKIIGESTNVGSVRLTELFITSHPVANAELAKLMDYARQNMNAIKDKFNTSGVKEVIAVAGTPTTLAAVVQERPYNKEAVEGFRLTLADMKSWLTRLAAMSVEERQQLPGMDPRRADVIVAGLAVLIAATELFGVSSVRVSDRGVRFGIALLGAERAV